MKPLGRHACALSLALASGCAGPPHARSRAPARVDPAAKNARILVFDGLFITEFVAPIVARVRPTNCQVSVR